MNWPQNLLEGNVLVALRIKHPRFGYLEIDKLQRSKEEMLLKKASIENQTNDDMTVFFYLGAYLTIKDVIHLEPCMVGSYNVSLEHYIVEVDWTGY